MPTTYREADLATHKRTDDLRDSFPDLREAAVSIRVMFAHNSDGKAAVKHHGMPAAAKIKINSLADRAEGKKDCTITIDADVWDNKSERQQEALLFHELNHLVVVRDKKTNNVKRDDLDCPRLQCQPDDYVINGFFDVAQRYGEDAQEAQTLLKIVGEYRQRGLFEDWDQPKPASRRRTAASH